MGTYARVVINDGQDTATVVVSSDGHHLGAVLIDCAEHWKDKANDDDPEPPPGTAAEFAEVLCGDHYGRQHNGEVVPAWESCEFDYVVSLIDGRVVAISATRLVFNHDAVVRALRAGRSIHDGTSIATRWTVEFPAVGT